MLAVKTQGITEVIANAVINLVTNKSRSPTHHPKINKMLNYFLSGKGNMFIAMNSSNN